MAARAGIPGGAGIRTFVRANGKRGPTCTPGTWDYNAPKHNTNHFFRKEAARPETRGPPWSASSTPRRASTARVSRWNPTFIGSSANTSTTSAKCYGERYARQFGYWRPIIDKTVDKFMQVWRPAARFCPGALPGLPARVLRGVLVQAAVHLSELRQKRTLLFGLHLADDVCRFVPHRQFVWTMPKRLRPFFRFHRQLLRRLPALAWQTVREVYQALLGRERGPAGSSRSRPSAA